MKPSRVLNLYSAAAFVIGTGLTIPLALMINKGELEAHAGLVLALCLNVFFLMVLPLVLDWSERKYFKAHFLELEELSARNPELKAVLEEQCQKLSLPGLRFATVDNPGSEPFAYGLWRQNPRLIVPSSWLNAQEVGREQIIPSIEVELARFARRDMTFLFLTFVFIQVLIQQLIINLV